MFTFLFCAIRNCRTNGLYIEENETDVKNGFIGTFYGFGNYLADCAGSCHYHCIEEAGVMNGYEMVPNPAEK